MTAIVNRRHCFLLFFPFALHPGAEVGGGSAIALPAPGRGWKASLSYLLRQLVGG